MKFIVITWGFNNETGSPELDCFLEIEDIKRDAVNIRLMELRSRSNFSNKMALFKIEEEITREMMQKFIASNTSYSQELLQKAKIKASDILREGNIENQAIDFIKF